MVVEGTGFRPGSRARLEINDGESSEELVADGSGRLSGTGAAITLPDASRFRPIRVTGTSRSGTAVVLEVVVPPTPPR